MRSVEELRPRLARYFAAKLGLTSEPEIRDLSRITVGHSRANYRIDLAYQENGAEITRTFAVRFEQGGMFGTSSLAELKVMRGLAGTGTPIANVRWWEADPSVTGQPFFVMDWVPGRADVPDRPTLRKYIRHLEDLHTLDWRGAGVEFELVPVVGRDGTLMQIDRWFGLYRRTRYRPVPVLEEIAAWLRKNAPDGPVGIVHGDPGPSNFLHANGEITALVDWEFTHLGNPNEDWSFLVSMRGVGIMPQPEWAALIEEITGTHLTDAEWRYWEVYNQFKGACANISALRVFVTRQNMAPNMVAIGTALHLRMVQRASDLIDGTA
ncbi:MAG TPA: phosphotransferase family protein [Dehalococcoidia bacterium]|nr:phosphotransferase family protein [Dehalococcoidia bacterium]